MFKLVFLSIAIDEKTIITCQGTKKTVVKYDPILVISVSSDVLDRERLMFKHEDSTLALP